ncbi:Melanocortin-2 receptor accessory protein [Tupaia chinensis]|uniref:Melanocortin-2 receptor accessory protein n=1 Tax=Tupaia chinensis TaxID=246437 RepID=L9KLQ1_TUPCH|nr:Melanocortin-2 receptor accessory protein [Tupaia chinensis]
MREEKTSPYSLIPRCFRVPALLSLVVLAAGPPATETVSFSADLIVIAFWVSLAAFVVLLFLILLCISWSGSLQRRNSPQPHPTCPWSYGLLLCIRRHLERHRATRGDLQTPQSSVEEPGSRAGPKQQPQRESSSAMAP